MERELLPLEVIRSYEGYNTKKWRITLPTNMVSSLWCVRLNVSISLRISIWLYLK